ncbi:MAG: ATP-binding protein [Myxococcota bacterium]
MSRSSHALADALARLLEQPSPADERLVRVGDALGLRELEILTVALIVEGEREPMVGRLLSRLQDPVGGSRPTLGLLRTMFEWATPGDVIDELLTGVAVQTGLLEVVPPGPPMPERALQVPPHLVMAVRGQAASVPGATVGPDPRSPPLTPSLLADARRYAHGLEHRPRAALTIRAGCDAERRAAAEAVAAALGLAPVFLRDCPLDGLVPWLLLEGLVPVFERELAPSERCVLPELVGYSGPVLATLGPDGGIVVTGSTPMSWSVPVPSAAERRELWERAVGDSAMAERLSRGHRHGCARIAELGRLARQRAAMDARSVARISDVLEASWSSDAGGLDALAEPMRARIDGDSLVLPDRIQQSLDLFVLRCRAREGLTDGLGSASSTRYRPGVRGLLVGPSGTGKTLAAGWLATQLDLPLYRVDAASVVSKYIGETEKNLAQLLARAEDAEVVLLFDEADSLFGKRTEVKQSNDRFANAQTNYLLQRIESYDGIVVLTSNSRSRFDSAFTRRLDFVIDFPAPEPEQRRDLWERHLGEEHDIDRSELNRLAATIDLCGGHIRNVVLCAAVLAKSESRRVGFRDLIRGLELEMLKLNRQVPASMYGQRSGSRVLRKGRRARAGSVSARANGDGTEPVVVLQGGDVRG